MEAVGIRVGQIAIVKVFPEKNKQQVNKSLEVTRYRQIQFINALLKIGCEKGLGNLN